MPVPGPGGTVRPGAGTGPGRTADPVDGRGQAAAARDAATAFQATLASAQRGEEAGFRGLFRSYQPLLLRYLAAQAPGHGEDLASETWLGAARTIRSFAGEEPAFRSWLFTIARRRLVQHWRDDARRPSTPVPVEHLADRPAVEDTGAAGLAALGAREAAALIVRLLPRDQAEVVLLRTVAGLDVGQVAGMLGKRPGTVRVLHHKALRRLAERLPQDALTP